MHVPAQAEAVGVFDLVGVMDSTPDGLASPVNDGSQQTLVAEAAQDKLPEGDFAYVTLLTRDSYLLGVQALRRSLKRVACRYPLIVMHTGKLSSSCMAALRAEGCYLHHVEPFLPTGQDVGRYKLALYAECWNKLAMWRLTQYRRLAYLDADTLALANLDHLFQLPPGFYAVRDCYNGRLTEAERATCPYLGGPQYFNAGFYVMSPSTEELEAMEAALAGGDGGVGGYAEQDFLNTWYHASWKALPWCYNAQKGIKQHHPELWTLQGLRLIHYTDAKPWNPLDEGNAPYTDIVGIWWDVFNGTAAAPLPAALTPTPPDVSPTPATHTSAKPCASALGNSACKHIAPSTTATPGPLPTERRLEAATPTKTPADACLDTLDNQAGPANPAAPTKKQLKAEEAAVAMAAVAAVDFAAAAAVTAIAATGAAASTAAGTAAAKVPAVLAPAGCF